MRRLILLLLCVVCVVVLMKGGSAASWTQGTQGDFENGTYDNTTSNSTGVVFLNQTTYPDLYNDTSMVLWFHYDDNLADTNVIDSSGSGNGGTLVGGNTEDISDSGKFDRSLHADGANHYVTANPIDLSSETEGTIAFWFNSDLGWNQATHDFIMVYYQDTSNRQLLGLYPGQGIVLQTTAGTQVVSDSATFTANTWYHVVITHDGTTTTMYVDGVAQADTEADSNWWDNVGTGNVFVTYGYHHDGAYDLFFDGYLDEFALWTRAFSADEVKDLHRRQKATYESQIINLGADQIFNFFGWTELYPYWEELPDNQEDEDLTDYHGANMTDNILLLHLNNDTAYGEGETDPDFVYDFSGNGYDGNASGNVVEHTTAKFGKSYYFDNNAGTMINISGKQWLNIGTTDFTTSAWFWCSSTPSSMVILSKKQSKGFNLFIHDNDFIQLSIDDGSNTAVNTGGDWDGMCDSSWHFVVAVWDRSANVDIYGDGELKTSGSISARSSSIDNDYYLTVGSNQAEQSTFSGYLDEVAMWNRTLSAAEIMNMYQRGVENNLTFQVRSCDDAACDVEVFVGQDNTSSTYFTNTTGNNLDFLVNNTYFQFKVYQDTTSPSFYPVLYNFTLDYSSVPPPVAAQSNVSYITPNIMKYPIVKLGNAIIIKGNLDVTGNLTYKTIYLEASDLNDQEFSLPDINYPINISTFDEGFGIDVSSPNISISFTGVYSLIAQPQITSAPGQSGTFHMWLEKWITSWDNVSNSNIELTLGSQDERVGVLAETLMLNAGEKIRVMGSVSDVDITLDYKAPANQPAIPSIIFTMYKLGE